LILARRLRTLFGIWDLEIRISAENNGWKAVGGSSPSDHVPAAAPRELPKPKSQAPKVN
jgi:hypothetical protein